MTYAFDNAGKLIAPTAAELAAADADLHSYLLVLDKGILNDGSPYWAYLAVKPSKYQAFLQAAKSGRTIQHPTYGTILKQGFDKEVPLAVKEEMKRKYGFDEDYLSKLAQEIQQAKTKHDNAQEDKRIANIVAMLKKK